MRDGSTHVRSSGRAYNTAAAVMTAAAGRRSYNLGMMRSAHNPRQRVLHCAGTIGWAQERLPLASGTAMRRAAAAAASVSAFSAARLAGRLRRRAGRLEFAHHRVGIDRCRCRGREIAGNTDHLDRHGQRLKSVQRVGHGEISRRRARKPNRAFCSPVRARCWHRPPTGSNSSWTVTVGGVGLNEEVKISGKRRTAGQTEPRHGNHDDTTHDPSVTCCG